MSQRKRELFLLKKFIREAIDLGKIQFAEDRLDIPKEMRTEENTPEEQELFSNIVGYVEMQEPLDKPQLAQLRNLVGDSGSPYNKFFAPYSSGEAYRGMYALDQKTIEEWIGRPMRKDEIENSEKWSEEDSNEFLKPVGTGGYAKKERNVLSFSKSYASAESFCKDYSYKSGGLYCAIVTARAEDNPRKFLDLQAGVYKLKSTQDMVHEQEVLGLGPILMSSVKWIYIP